MTEDDLTKIPPGAKPVEFPIRSGTVKVWYDLDGQEWRSEKEALESSVRKKLADLWYKEGPGYEPSGDDVADWVLQHGDKFVRWLTALTK